MDNRKRGNMQPENAVGQRCLPLIYPCLNSTPHFLRRQGCKRLPQWHCNYTPNDPLLGSHKAVEGCQILVTTRQTK